MKKSAILSAVLVGIFSFVLVASAADYTPLAPLPGTFTETAGVKTTNPSMYLAGAIKLLIALGGATAILMAIIGGTQYVASGIAPSAKQDAKNRITSAFIGLALVLTSYLILNSINPKLVAVNFMLPAIGTAPGATPANTGAGVGTNTLSNGATNSAIQSAAQPSSNILSSVSSQSSPTSVVLEQSSVDSTNDYSIITHCLIVPTYDLCSRADLNNDGKTDSADFMLFAERGGRLDLNSDKTIELDARPTPVSCFFKKNTVSLSSILPRVVEHNNFGENFNVYWATPLGCSGTGGIYSPTASCNGQTWLKWSVLGSACAGDMSFGFDPLGVGNYTKFQGWVIGATSGNRINLTDLFVRIFYDTTMDAGWPNDGVTGFKETTLADVSYSTVAQYDLNNDGIADLNETGADMKYFTGTCEGHSASGLCAQADFNNDGTVDASDIFFRDLMMRDLFSQPTDVLMATSTVNTAITGGIEAMMHGLSFSFAPYRWFINWFESMLFSVSKYTDRQIVQYCVGHKPFEKCGMADIDDSCLAQYRACGTVMTCRAQAESCKVGASDITNFDTLARPLDINRDGKVNLR